MNLDQDEYFILVLLFLSAAFDIAFSQLHLHDWFHTISYHCYADNILLYFSVKPTNLRSLSVKAFTDISVLVSFISVLAKLRLLLRTLKQICIG